MDQPQLLAAAEAELMDWLIVAFFSVRVGFDRDRLWPEGTDIFGLVASAPDDDVLLMAELPIELFAILCDWRLMGKTDVVSAEDEYPGTSSVDVEDEFFARGIATVSDAVMTQGRGGFTGGCESKPSADMPERVFIALVALTWELLLATAAESMLATPVVTTGAAARPNEFVLIILGLSVTARTSGDEGGLPASTAELGLGPLVLDRVGLVGGEPEAAETPAFCPDVAKSRAGRDSAEKGAGSALVSTNSGPSKSTFECSPPLFSGSCQIPPRYRWFSVCVKGLSSQFGKTMVSLNTSRMRLSIARRITPYVI